MVHPHCLFRLRLSMVNVDGWFPQKYMQDIEFIMKYTLPNTTARDMLVQYTACYALYWVQQFGCEDVVFPSTGITP